MYSIENKGINLTDILSTIMKEGEELPPSITAEKGNKFDGDIVLQYNDEKVTCNQLGALSVLIGRIDTLNPKNHCGIGYQQNYMKISLEDNRIYKWENINNRILSACLGWGFVN